MDSVDLYEIKDSELDLLERGSPASLCLNFSIFLLSLAFSALGTLATATTFKHPLVETVLVVVMVIGFLGGAFLILIWRKDRSSVADVCDQIRRRIPPDVTQLSEPGAVAAAEGGVQLEPSEPKG